MRVPFREKSALATVVAVHRTERSERHPSNRSGRGRSADLERTIARTGQMDQRLLLLPDRNSDAQLVAASHPARGSRMEKAIVRPARAQRSTTKNLRSCENARPGRRNFWRQSRDWKRQSARSQLLRQTSLDNQTLRALVKRGLVGVARRSSRSGIHMLTNNSSRRRT